MKRLACPARYKGDNSDAAQLRALVGPRVLKLLQRHFGGRRIWIPKGCARAACATCGLRDQCVRAWRRAGKSAAHIAAFLNVSPKTVYRVSR